MKFDLTGLTGHCLRGECKAKSDWVTLTIAHYELTLQTPNPIIQRSAFESVNWLDTFTGSN